MSTTDTPSTNSSLEVEKTGLSLKLTVAGLNYQRLIQEGELIVFTRENLDQDYSSLASLRKVKKQLEDEENPYLKLWQTWNAARKSLLDPVKVLLAKKTKEFTDLNETIKAENAVIAAQNAKTLEIETHIQT